MQQLIGIWQRLDLRRQLIVVGATVATFAAVLVLSGMASRPTMGLLYSGLRGDAAGEVLAALDQRGAVYEVRGEAIFVDATQRDQLRMALASEGLPANGGSGYELLDDLSGFGTTAQMFDAAYWRAKEGELARTLTANPAIRSVRVHISSPVAQGLRQAARPTASIMVTTSGGGLAPPQAKAMKHLVASAVAGMAPDDVSVIDAANGLVLSSDEARAANGGDEKAAELRENVLRLIEARVGPGKAVVELAVDTVSEREAITERRFDPDGRVAISTDTEERTNSSNDSRAGAVTVASNLPSGAASGGDGNSQSQGTETRERTNFEVSETTREVLRQPGAIRRITVAVLVDGITTTDDAGAVTWAPRPAEEIAALEDLVASAVGFDEARNDVITIRSLPFEALAVLGTAAEPGVIASLGLDLMKLAQAGVLAIVALVLGLFVLRPILTKPPLGLPAPATLDTSAPRRDDIPVLTGVVEDGDFSLGGLPDLSMGGMAGLPEFGGNEEPVARLRRLIEDRKDETVELLKTWIDEPQTEGS